MARKRIFIMRVKGRKSWDLTNNKMNGLNNNSLNRKRKKLSIRRFNHQLKIIKIWKLIKINRNTFLFNRLEYLKRLCHPFRLVVRYRKLLGWIHFLWWQRRNHLVNKHYTRVQAVQSYQTSQTRSYRYSHWNRRYRT